MAIVFERSKGTLSERLLAALVAGQKAGGMITGKQSTALVVKGVNNEWFNQIDLRVDHSTTPFEDLSRLLSYHYGRIRLNQAIFQLKKGNLAKGVVLLEQATTMLEGWQGMKARIAMANILAGREAQAVNILNGVDKEYMPAFYCLKNRMNIDTVSFDSKDWNSAVEMLTQVKRFEDALSVAKRVVMKYPDDSYSWYVLGKAYGNSKEAEQCFKKALALDKENVSAEHALKKQTRE
jgi:tetratricopeptide (TPR) repeat protein